MPEIATSPSTEQVDEASPEGTPTPQPTVEEVEAIWKKRVSGKDKAHEAEVAELRRQLEAARTPQPASAPAGETPEQVRIRELEERLKRTEVEKALAERKARFPHAAEDLGEDIASVDEARLARLEARLAAEEAAPPPIIASNSARRGEPAQTPVEPTREDLLRQLAELSPLYEEALRERYG